MGRGPHHGSWWVPSRCPMPKIIPALQVRILFFIPRYWVLQYLPFGIIHPRMILDLEELNLKEDYHLTQHAKINLRCNKLMQPSKPFLKHKTNIKKTLKI